MNKKHVVILGAGSGGAIIANKLAKQDVDVTLIDGSQNHYYQPGFLFVPFGKIELSKLSKPIAGILKDNILFINQYVNKIDTQKQIVVTTEGTTVNHDALIIATGTHTDPNITIGMTGPGWRKNIFDFYSRDGAVALYHALQALKGGRLVVQIAEKFSTKMY